MRHKQNLRATTAAAIAASFLMLALGLSHRILAARLCGPVNVAPIDPSALWKLPLQIGDWTGEDIPLDERIVRIADVEAYVNRRYSHNNGLQSVSLYIACGVDADKVIGHYPDVCYIRSGWTLLNRRSVELPLNDATKLPCTVFEFSRGGLDTERVTVLDHFIVDGQYYANLSLLRSKGRPRLSMVDYAAQIQIVASAETLTSDLGTRLVFAFAVDSASSIGRLFQDLEKDRNSGQPGKALEGK